MGINNDERMIGQWKPETKVRNKIELTIRIARPSINNDNINLIKINPKTKKEGESSEECSTISMENNYPDRSHRRIRATNNGGEPTELQQTIQKKGVISIDQ